MQNLAAVQNYSLEEYAELEKSSEERLEFFKGNVWSMAGASPTHEEIVANLITELKTKLRGRGCRVFSSNLRVKVPVYKPYRYPDVTALCDEPIYEDFFGLKVLLNPSLIVEILPSSTRGFDLGDKFTYYKSIENFTEYLLIDQEKPHIVLYTKQSSDVWLQREFNELNDVIYLSSLSCEISAAEVYLDIEFPETGSDPFPFGHPDFR